MLRPSTLTAALLVLPTSLFEPHPPPHDRPLPLTTVEGRVLPRTTLAALLSKVLSPSSVEALVRAARPVYDLARLAVGHPYTLSLGPDSYLAGFSYEIDELRTLRVERSNHSLAATVEERSFDLATKLVRGEIATSLFAAVNDAGEGDTLALQLADIFAWDVDFHTELRPGDTFRIAVEELSLDGKPVREGRILAAELLRGARRLQAVWFDTVDGPGYYTPSGRPLRKAFLRSPLKFTRISSGFTHARLHPILGIMTPHLGIDYAAPTGTPVLASADGLVSLAGIYGGFGEAVRLRHANGYETLYGHLSRILVRPGQRVFQGQVIGNVGATGLATGPHLDYRMSRNGVFLNPLTVELPPAEPIPDRERPSFDVVRDRDLQLLGTGPAASD